MPKIRVERVPVQTLFLGLLGFDHLQLVYQQNDADTGEGQDAWFVMEGLRESGLNGVTLAVEGLDGGTTLTEANGGRSGEDLVARIGTPTERGSRIVFDADAAPAWAALTAIAGDIDAQAFPYFAFSFAASPAPTINSSSLIASLLYHVGADISAVIPFGTRLSPGTETLLGTSGDERLALVSNFTTIVGGAGKDTLAGSEDTGQIDKLYGGTGDDTIEWSPGFNVVHGGQTDLDYANDGIDTIDYQGVGLVEINMNPNAVAHYQPDLFAVSATGTDHLYSIEQVAWDEESDIVVLGEGVSSIQRSVKLDLGGEESGTGDRVDFSGSDQSLLINAGDGELMFVQAEGRSETDEGLWVEGAEWLAGSAHDDRIYAGAHVHGVEGGQGADLVDARLVAPFSGASPRGFDVEIDGGAGGDTIVSGFGRTIATGGDGADRFVLSTMTFGLETVEFVIEDATAEDRAFVPYDFLNITYGDAEGSLLFPLLGAFSQQAGQNSFADLPENLGPWRGGPPGRDDFFRFEWQLQDQRIFGSDETQGLITFAGMILYNREGDDLLIHVFLGFPAEVTEPGSNELPWTHTINIFIPPSETILRVKDFTDGDLGIVFHDIGEPTTVDVETDHGPYGASVYPGWDEAVSAMTNSGQFSPALEARPETPEYDPTDTGPGDDQNVVAGTEDGDTIVIADARDTTIEAGGGEDTIEAGDGDDVTDGGAGADSMAGGQGDDIYLVDDAGDQVVEAANEGIDTVRASIDYALPDFVENLTLVSGGAGPLSLLAFPAETGTGNGLANRILGNEGDNALLGLGAADTLFGGLGDDLLDGGAGSDGYVYAAGHGADVIVDAGPAADRDLLLLSGIAPGAVSFHRLSFSPDDLVLTFEQGGRILLSDFWAAAGAGIDAIQFDDRTMWSRAEIESRGLAAPALAGDPPQAQDDFDLVVRGTDVLIPWVALLANDRDFDGDTLSIVSVSGVTPGAAVSIGAGSLHLVTAPSFEGPVGFTYEVSDGHGGVDTAAVEIIVIANHAPVANGDGGFETAAGAAISITDQELLANDTDADGDTLTVLSVQGASHGTVSRNATGVIVFTPAAGFSGAASFSYTVSDGHGGTSTATVSITVDAPPANVITGTWRDEVLTGTAANEIFDGRGGDDTLIGKGGDDIFLVRGKHAGLDIFKGGAGFDTVQGSDGNDIVGLADAAGNLNGIEAIGGGGGFDTLKLTGSNDLLDLSNIAVAGIERIALKAGDDRIVASAGRDYIVGGSGDDTFVFRGAFGDDVIADFRVGPNHASHADVIVLRGQGIHSMAELRAHAVQSADDTVITLDGGSITLLDVALNRLKADDFHFV